MGKFICSSSGFGDFLFGIINTYGDSHNKIDFKMDKGELSTGSIRTFVTPKKDFDFEMNMEAIIRLSSILKLLHDQPLTLFILDNGWVEIQNIII